MGILILIRCRGRCGSVCYIASTGWRVYNRHRTRQGGVASAAPAVAERRHTANIGCFGFYLAAYLECRANARSSPNHAGSTSCPISPRPSTFRTVALRRDLAKDRPSGRVINPCLWMLCEARSRRSRTIQLAPCHPRSRTPDITKGIHVQPAGHVPGIARPVGCVRPLSGLTVDL